MLADLALVELLFSDAHPRGNTRREVRTAFLAIDVTEKYYKRAYLQFVDDIVALRAVVLLLLLLVDWRMSEE